MEKTVKILLTELVTHDVKRFILEKPKNYHFTPGQATDVAINKEGFRDQKRPFTFTSLNEESILEFVIKSYPRDKYPDHLGVTEALHQLKQGEELIIGEPWGTINYKGPGVFIAGGAGITPFIAIIRQLRKDKKLTGNKLFFSNKEKRDVILEPELRATFTDFGNLVLTLTRKTADGYENGRIDQDFLAKKISDFAQNFYVCGPKQMVEDIKSFLAKLGAKSESLIFEE